MNNSMESPLTALLSGYEVALSGENGNEFPGCTLRREIPRRPVRVCCCLKFSAPWNDAELSCGLEHESCFLVIVACVICVWEVPD
jgi:hypothetical protein